jgi:hypothetical protein
MKASDLRMVFGRSLHTPFYVHSAAQRGHKVQGIKSAAFKSEAKLCAKCNNDLTQPYDDAWKRMSHYIHHRNPVIATGDLIRFSHMFPVTPNKYMVLVHLFFVKLFGCLVKEQGVPLATETFAEALLQRTPHPMVYLAISPNSSPVRAVGYSDLHIQLIRGDVAFAVWMYCLENFLVRVMYAAPGERREGLIHAWHPYRREAAIRVGAF